MEGHYKAPQLGIHPPGGHQLVGLPDRGPLSSSSGMAGRPTAIISASGSLSPAYIGVPTVSGSRLGG